MTKAYWVDFECWGIAARSADEAQEIVEKMMADGELPKITNIEPQEIDVSGTVRG